MRLGGPVLGKPITPDQWAVALKELGYSAAYSPVNSPAPADSIRAYREVAEKNDIVIAEVGAWSNPISRDEKERKEASDKCKAQLALAEEIGAVCCVNIAGSRGKVWDGGDGSHYSAEVFELIVESVREIIDAVRPTRTCYALETMPWTPPDSAESYLALIKAVDRKAFAVHLDPVNLVNSPGKYFQNGALIRECFQKLGPRIKSCHAKDIILRDKLTVHLDEVRPGLGNLDYRVYLSELARLDPNTPLMLEHLSTAEEYAAAAAHIRKVTGEIGVTINAYLSTGS